MAVEQKRPSVTQTGGREATTGVIPGRYALSVGMPDSTPPPGWRWMPLSSVARLESGHTPSRRVPEYWNGDIPWIGIRDATENHGRTISTTHQTVTQAGIDNSSARVLPAGTVCLSRTASVGYVVVMGRPMATSQDFVNWICSDAIDNNFLKYVLLSENESMLRFASGTTHQTIYYPEVKAFHVCLPEIAEQRAIVSVLSSLDDKIELNRRMNETLEEMAQALFKSWFVDFEPVRARAERRAPEGVDAETASLFPDSFEISELGEVPKGWQAGRIGDNLQTVLGGTPSRSNSSYWTNGTVPWINSGKVNEFRITAPTEYITEEAMANSAAKLLPKRTTVLAITGATLGQVSLLEIAACANQSVIGILQSEHIPSEFIYFWVKHRIGDLVSAQTGGAQQHVNKNDVNNLKILYPDVEILNAYKRIVSPLFDAILVNYFESETLTAIRDALLPKLMSGEIRVKP